MQTLTELQREGDGKRIGGDLNTPFSTLHRTSSKKMNKETENANNAVNQVGLTDVLHRAFFSNAHRPFSKTQFVHFNKQKA